MAHPPIAGGALLGPRAALPSDLPRGGARVTRTPWVASAVSFPRTPLSALSAVYMALLTRPLLAHGVSHRGAIQRALRAYADLEPLICRKGLGAGPGLRATERAHGGGGESRCLAGCARSWGHGPLGRAVGLKPARDRLWGLAVKECGAETCLCWAVGRGSPREGMRGCGH